jgi:hypothetical protein
MCERKSVHGQVWQPKHEELIKKSTCCTWLGRRRGRLSPRYLQELGTIIQEVLTARMCRRVYGCAFCQMCEITTGVFHALPVQVCEEEGATCSSVQMMRAMREYCNAFIYSVSL